MMHARRFATLLLLFSFFCLRRVYSLEEFPLRGWECCMGIHRIQMVNWSMLALLHSPCFHTKPQNGGLLLELWSAIFSKPTLCFGVGLAFWVLRKGRSTLDSAGHDKAAAIAHLTHNHGLWVLWPVGLCIRMSYVASSGIYRNRIQIQCARCRPHSAVQLVSGGRWQWNGRQRQQRNDNGNTATATAANDNEQ